MGLFTPGGKEQASQLLAGQFTATGQSSAIPIYGAFNALIYGSGGLNTAWVGTVRLERSFDGGTTWIVCGTGGSGAQASYATGADVSVTLIEPERGVLYRFNCTAFSSGTILYRISSSSGAVQTWQPGIAS